MFAALSEYPKVELVMVMIVTPLVMNSFQYWVQDSFLKKKLDLDECELLAEQIEMNESSYHA
jgi:hypothetical protein